VVWGCWVEVGVVCGCWVEVGVVWGCWVEVGVVWGCWVEVGVVCGGVGGVSLILFSFRCRERSVSPRARCFVIRFLLVLLPSSRFYSRLVGAKWMTFSLVFRARESLFVFSLVGTNLKFFLFL
jgi:hypothetical protein